MPAGGGRISSLASRLPPAIFPASRMREWKGGRVRFKAHDSKSCVGLNLPWVRIPPLPPLFCRRAAWTPGLVAMGATRSLFSHTEWSGASRPQHDGSATALVSTTSPAMFKARSIAAAGRVDLRSSWALCRRASRRSQRCRGAYRRHRWKTSLRDQCSRRFGKRGHSLPCSSRR